MKLGKTLCCNIKCEDCPLNNFNNCFGNKNDTLFRRLRRKKKSFKVIYKRTKKKLKEVIK